MNKYSAAGTAEATNGRVSSSGGRPSVGVAGATGYAGRELVRLLARHPGANLTVATVSTPSDERREVPALRGVWTGGFRPLAIDNISGLDAVFLALPENVGAKVALPLVDAGVRVFNLSGAFRLRDGGERARWYPETPALPETGLVYGLTEMCRAQLPEARLVACPGCYPTAALLALGPLVRAGYLVSGAPVVVDAKSGISGAGASTRTHFSELHGNVAAYNIFGHRHVAEIEQELGGMVTFVPHLVPLNKGILETIYVQMAEGVSDADVAGCLQAAYTDAPGAPHRIDAPEIRTWCTPISATSGGISTLGPDGSSWWPVSTIS